MMAIPFLDRFNHSRVDLPAEKDEVVAEQYDAEAKAERLAMDGEGWWQMAAGSVVVASVVVTPLLFSQVSRELFEFPKMVWLYGLGWLAAGLLGVRWFKGGAMGLPSHWLKWAIVFYVGSFWLSTALSISWYTSVMGYYSRFSGGLASVMAYAGLAWLALVWLKSGKGLERQWWVVYGWLGASAVVSGWAILEHFGHDPSCLILVGRFSADCWVQDVQARVFATFGQPNWLASYLLVSLPLSVAVLMKSGWRRWLGLVSLWLGYAGWWYTFSRAGWLGLAGGVGLIGVSLASGWWGLRKGATFSHDRRWRWILVAVIGCVVISLSGIQMAGKRTTTSLESGDFDSSTGQMRLLVWQGAVAAFSHYPIWGSGPETFAYSFLPYRPAAMNMTTEWNFLYNKAHNELLQTAVDRGVIGVVSWLGVWVAVGWMAVRQGWLWKVRMDDEQKILGLALIAGMVGVFISQLLGFAVVMTSWSWWLGLAMITSLAWQTKGDKALEERTSTLIDSSKVRLSWKWAGLVGGVVVWGMVGYGGGRYVVAEIVSSAAGYGGHGAVEAGLMARQAADLNPFEPYYAQQVAWYYASRVSGTDEMAAALSRLAKGFAERAEGLNPYNLITKKQLGWTYSQLSQTDSKEYGQAEIELWQRAVEWAVTDAASWQSLAEAYSKVGQWTEAERAYTRLIELRPMAASYAGRASLYSKQGLSDKAAADMARARELEPWNEDYL